LADKKFVEGVKSEVKAIVPASTLRDVMGFISDSMEEVEVLISDTQIRFRMGEIEVTSKLIDASFPEYRALIPKNISLNLELDKAELQRMTKVAALFARSSGGSITCEALADAGTFSVSAVASELGENSSSLEVEVASDAKVTLNSRYLLDALNAAKDTHVMLGISGKLDPVVLTNAQTDDYTHIIMPLKS
jgi:DNA polymerase-3 subunit beta